MKLGALVSDGLTGTAVVVEAPEPAVICAGEHSQEAIRRVCVKRPARAATTDPLSHLLYVCPTRRDERELALLFGPGAKFQRHDYTSRGLQRLFSSSGGTVAETDDFEREIHGMLARCRASDVRAVISTDDYPGTILAAIVADELGVPGPRPTANLACQHKARSRQIQAAAVPWAVPVCAVIDVDDAATLPPPERFPLFVKPVKSLLSVGAQRVVHREQLRAIMGEWSKRDAFFAPFETLVGRYFGPVRGRRWLLAEALLEGDQATLDGYVWNGEVHILGVVDSVMFPGTIAFQRFEYPSSLPNHVQEAMAAIAKRVMPALGFDGGAFNIEFIHDPASGSVHIVEINPRISSQFADLFEKVDGTNSYSVALDLAFGRRPAVQRRRGPHRVAFSCVLRRFSDARVRTVPSQAEIDALGSELRDARIEVLATAGTLLSAQLQDTCSYRYGLINLGADDRDEALEKFEHCQHRLTFDFDPP